MTLRDTIYLLALAVGSGLQVLGTFMEAEVTELVGPKGQWNRDRTAVRRGEDHGEVERSIVVGEPAARTRQVSRLRALVTSIHVGCHAWSWRLSTAT